MEQNGGNIHGSVKIIIVCIKNIICFILFKIKGGKKDCKKKLKVMKTITFTITD